MYISVRGNEMEAAVMCEKDIPLGQIVYPLHSVWLLSVVQPIVLLMFHTQHLRSIKVIQRGRRNDFKLFSRGLVEDFKFSCSSGRGRKNNNEKTTPTLISLPRRAMFSIERPDETRLRGPYLLWQGVQSSKWPVSVFSTMSGRKINNQN